MIPKKQKKQDKSKDKEIQDLRKEIDRLAKAFVKRDMEFLKLSDNLRQIDDAKSQFVSVAAHQLRTPLSIIKWIFKMLLSGDFGPVTEEQKKVITRGYDANERMIGLISDLLNVARVDSGQVVYNFESVSIEDIVNEAIEANRLAAENRDLELRVINLIEGQVPPVWADKQRIGIVLQNLIGNAINYTLPEGTIDVTYKKVDGFMEVQVKDTGVGVPKNQQHSLFTKFFRGSNVVRMQTQGTGLGLYIAASMVRNHGGQIGVVSEEGRGSTFWFRIPINKK